MDHEILRERIGSIVLDVAFQVHSELGPGLLECVYESALALELSSRGHLVQRQHPVAIYYQGILLKDIGFRADLIIDSAVLIELKSVAHLTDIHKKITWNYLRLIPLRLGYLINFNERRLKDGICRITNGSEGRPYFDRTRHPTMKRKSPELP